MTKRCAENFFFYYYSDCNKASLQVSNSKNIRKISFVWHPTFVIEAIDNLQNTDLLTLSISLRFIHYMTYFKMEVYPKFL